MRLEKPELHVTIAAEGGMVMGAAHDRYWLFVCWRTRGYTRQSWISALAVIFAVAAATLPPASPALASILGWEVVSQRSVIDSISKGPSRNNFPFWSCRPGRVVERRLA